MAAPKIEMIAPKDLKPYERNARTHPPSQRQQIMASMQAFGFRNPILIDAESEVIAGHGRLEAALEMGIAKVPCVRCNGLDEAQVKPYLQLDKLREGMFWVAGELLGLSFSPLEGIPVYHPDVSVCSSGSVDWASLSRQKERTSHRKCSGKS